MRIQITDEKGLAAITSDNEYELSNDVKVSKSWVSLSGVSGVTIYGNGYKISRLYKPLFGSVSFVKLYNVAVECDIHELSGRYVGAFMRYGLQPTLSECKAHGFVSGAEYVGGLVGDASQATIEHCVNYAEISASSYFGGIVGCVSHSNVSGNVNHGGLRPIQKSVFGGGIAGKMQDECYVCDNVNYGTINEFKINCCGGIVGGLSGSRVFRGNINRGIINGGRHVGGIAGIADNSCILNNECIMPVSGNKDNTGGIVGYAESAPLLVSGNVAAGAVDCAGDNGGGIVGLAAAGTIITDNTLSCPAVRAIKNVGRILGSAAGDVYLRNFRIYANCLMSGKNGNFTYKDQFVYPDDVNAGSGGMMGESYFPPEGFKVSGLRLSPIPIEEEATTDEKLIADPSLAAVAKMVETFRQITASLSIGSSALANAFQISEEILVPLLKREKNTIRTLRQVRETIDAYCDFIDSAEKNIDSMTENDEAGLSLPNQIRRVVISCDSERTNQPLAGASLFVRGEGYDRIMVSDIDGHVVLDNPSEGVYEISEHTAPYCYQRSAGLHKIEVGMDDAIVDGARVTPGNGEVNLRIGHVRDESQLFISGENWAARPEAWKTGLIPHSAAYTSKDTASDDAEDSEAREIAAGVLSELLNVTDEAAGESLVKDTVY
ncbi:MAG: prealbumin-like fold domain-containing protein [Oscillospiraceae bacterium]|jgi:hypothetical protein|nr:prealbumin-like fold domain-containing protein [Oscillospiraceae bacterium]